MADPDAAATAAEPPDEAADKPAELSESQKLDKLTAFNEKLVASNAQLHNDIQLLRNDCNNRIGAAEQQLPAHTTQIAGLVDEKKRHGSRIAELESENERLTADVRKLQNEHTNAVNASKGQSKELKLRLSAVEDSAQHLQTAAPDHRVDNLARKLEMVQRSANASKAVAHGLPEAANDNSSSLLANCMHSFQEFSDSMPARKVGQRRHSWPARPVFQDDEVDDLKANWRQLHHISPTTELPGG